MAPLKNIRHERFCLELAAGCSQAEAVKRAGYAGGSGRYFASRLRRFPDVVARLKELEEATVSESVFTIIRRKEALSEIIRKEARAHPMAAIAAISELNKMDRAYEAPKEERPPIRIIEVRLPAEPEAVSGNQVSCA